jgi:predicted secreted acid phosphatase
MSRSSLTYSEESVKHLPSIQRPARTVTIAFASAAAGIALGVPGFALASHSGQAVPAPPANPTSDSQIQNIDQVKTAIKGYYGDTTTTTPDPVTGGTVLHQYSATGAYARQVQGIAATAAKTLSNHQKRNATKALLFDIDDTTLNTYSYEIYSNFVFNPTTNASFVNAGSATVFPAVPGMVGLEKAAEAKGYQIYFLTGRPVTQTAGTLANLTDAGYHVDPTHVFLKDTTAQTEPWLASCVDPATSKFVCTTIQYKSLTRQHIEQDLGVDIVANFGDQFSDLKGGFADSTYKIPNPMYFLP